MTNVLVIGGAGYVGSHACKALAGAGYTPVTFDDLSTGHDWAVRWGPFEKGSILEPSALDAAMKKHDPAAVLHFASRISVGESVEKPEEYYEINVAGSVNVLEAMRRHGCSTFVFSSSAAVYAGNDFNIIPETAPLAPGNPYGHTKQVVEQVLKEFNAAHGFRAMALRYFNAAGADPAGDIGEDHEPETHLIPLAIKSALGLEPGLSIFGGDYPTEDGTCVRDYVHVEDLARAHVLAMECLRANGGIDFINLGGGQGRTVRQVVDTVQAVSGRDFPVTVTARRAGDAVRLVADIARAEEVLGWHPEKSDLKTVVETAWAWHAKHHGKK
ncbi:MAG: UDP-glucose 4-epimerase GalE [Rhodospirillales bacterium]